MDFPQSNWVTEYTTVCITRSVERAPTEIDLAPMLTRLIQFGLSLTFIVLAHTAEASVRETPVVKAIRRAQGAVANIHSEKTADDGSSLFAVDRARKVNGMGTGVIIDERGYIVTKSPRR